MASQDQYANQEQDFYADLASRLRDIEERIRLMKDRTLLISKGFVEERDKTSQEIQDLKKSILELKQENIKVKNFIQNIAEQVDSAARKSELEILQRQFDIFRKRVIMARENLDQRAEQERIKAAVSDTAADAPGVIEESQTQARPSATEGMEPSMFSSTDIAEPQEAPAPEADPAQTYAPQQSQQYQYPAENYQDYSQYAYAPQTSAESSDILSEIAEQIVAEKTSAIRNDLDRVKDFRTTMETKVENITERLQRIEKTIDKLQLSILQKVGDYVSNVESLKTELIETQKSFKAVHEKNKPQHPQHSQQHPSQSEYKHKRR